MPMYCRQIMPRIMPIGAEVQEEPSTLKRRSIHEGLQYCCTRNPKICMTNAAFHRKPVESNRLLVRQAHGDGSWTIRIMLASYVERTKVANGQGLSCYVKPYVGHCAPKTAAQQTKTPTGCDEGAADIVCVEEV